MLLEILYVSRCRHRFDDASLTDLLRVARRNNQAHDITGLLLYDGRGTFIQVLEGPQAAVDPLYERISADNRHDHVHLLSRQSIKKRSFPDWQMGFYPMTSELIRKVDGFSDFLFSDANQRIDNQEQAFALRMLDYFRLKARREQEDSSC